MRRTLIIIGAVLAVGGVGTASASLMITSVGQIAPNVRARLAGINSTVSVHSRKKIVCSDGTCPAAAIAYAYCPRGTAVTGGGFYEGKKTFISTTGASAPVHTSHGFGWGALVADIGKTNGAFYAVVVCGAHRTAAASDARATTAGSLDQLRASLIRTIGH